MRYYPRLLELLLLLIAFGLTGSAFLAVFRADYGDRSVMQEALRLAWPMGSFLAAHWILSVTRPRANQVLVPLVASLTGIGLVFLYRIPADFPIGHRPHPLTGQSWAVVIGVIAMLVLANIRDVRALSRFKYLCMVAGIGLLLLTALAGEVVHGKALNVRIGSAIEFQPTELVKLLLVIFMAGYLAERSRLISQRWGRWIISSEDLRYLGPLFGIWVASQMLLFYQKDLGAALLFFGVFLAMIFISNARPLYLAIGWALFAGGAAYAYEFSARTQERIKIWLNPWKYGSSSGYQVLQGLFALGFGGLFGAGWGRGAPHFIPAVQTDFIFVGLAEEIGLLGSLGILALYLMLVWQGLSIALRARNNFATLLAAGLTIVIVIQVIVIVGGSLTLIPLTGVPVPFLSRGGTNMVCNLALIGILLAISAERSSGGAPAVAAAG
ncbi:MAG TPA: FtsW/RodA/SpoVE family cell cycle protein [Armatimonadota bacterium]|nr:FtsW/RodA/SpoVE family cell cycle protein [Armatimonadota bacterium]